MNTIVHGDCAVVLQSFPDNSIDFIITSPPYGTQRNYGGFDFDFETIAKQLYRVLKKGSAMVWVIGDKTEDGSESLESFRQALYFKEIGFKMHDTMIYQKNGTSFPNLESHKRYMQCFEYMFVLSKGKLQKWNPLKDRKNKYDNSIKSTHVRDRKTDKVTYRKNNIKYHEYNLRYNVWLYDTGYMKSSKDKIAFEHPAIFPEKLVEDHIKSWSDPGDLILDPFMGSGTTAKIALMNGRNFIGIESNLNYINIINKRIEPYLKQEKLL